jgi:hypothetical protein
MTRIIQIKKEEQSPQLLPFFNLKLKTIYKTIIIAKGFIEIHIFYYL